MALQKSQTLGNGATGNYWVAEPHCNKQNNTTLVTMLLFTNQAGRTAGNTPLLRQTLGALTGVYPTGVEVYAWVKRSILVKNVETNFFIDAVDC
jgi:hypothetical protein